MNKWILRGSGEDIAEISKELDISPIIVKILLNRGISKEQMSDFVSSSDKQLNSYNDLSDIKKGSETVCSFIKGHKKIRIVGDYDVDGICSTSILVLGLREVGANVDYAVPNREKDGYGINKDIVQKAHDDGVDLIITCDNGIAAFEAIDYAKEIGISIIITDHHNIPLEDGRERIPNADAVINPKLNDYPFELICGGFVALKLIQSVFEMRFHKSVIYKELEILAGFATICDVMPLIDENRTIVKKALRNISNTILPGLRALLDVNDVELSKVNAYTFGFVLGPTLNSSGRLADASLGIELFLSKDYQEAVKIAVQLKELNSQRQYLTNIAYEQAEKLIVENNLISKKILCILLRNAHHSIAGIVAGRIKEKYYRPTLVFTESEDGITGSGRSIEAYDLFENLSKIKDEFTKFGGHKLAAGMSANLENLSNIDERLNKDCILTDDELTPKIYIDAAINFKIINENFIETVSILEPYGAKNPKPLFAVKGVKVINKFEIGKQKQYLKLNLKDANTSITAMLFKNVDDMKEILEKNSKIDIVFSVQLNEWNGIRTPQILIEDFRENME